MHMEILKSKSQTRKSRPLICISSAYVGINDEKLIFELMYYKTKYMKKYCSASCSYCPEIGGSEKKESRSPKPLIWLQTKNLTSSTSF